MAAYDLEGLAAGAGQRKEAQAACSDLTSIRRDARVGALCQ
ncbi:hypothetical protein KP78_37420 [Jeotgalibacillus soli]|uniref:Uncharacterized protein n=2 Tax=Jeotgalibacillus soli TaxID=889306 RepID=A0A0C2VIU6_9BACL|nr:hypothetical protein KP78_37420 [Jeotgalibacillus soli]